MAADPQTLQLFTRLVQLDVVVNDKKGHPVPGLKASDFTVLEDGVPQPITRFKAHQPSALPLPPPLALPPNTFTNFVPGIAPDATPTVIVMPMYAGYTDYADLAEFAGGAFVFEQVQSYVKSAPRGTPFAIFFLDFYETPFATAYKLRLLQGFTTDPAVLVAALKTRRTMPSIGGRFDINAYQYLKPSFLGDGTAGLVHYLAGIPGRKNLILFNGSDPANGTTSQMRDTTSFAGDLTQFTDTLSFSRVAVYVIDEWGVTLAPRPYESGQFDRLTNGTGGWAMLSGNGIKDAIREVVDGGRTYYTLSYKPTNDHWDGTFRHIAIQSTRDASFKLAYRNGYFATDRRALERKHLAEARLNPADANFQATSEALPPPSPGLIRRDAPTPPRDPKNAFKDSLEDAMVLGTMPSTEILFVAQVSPSLTVQELPKGTLPPPGNYLRSAFQGKPTRDYELLFALRLDEIHLVRSADGIRHGNVSFISVAYGTGGQVVNSLLTTVTLDLSGAQYRHLRQTGLSMTQHLAIPAKGVYFLRLGVGDAADREVGALEIPVDQIKLLLPESARIQ